MTEDKSKNISWHVGSVSRNDREELLQQKGVVLWFTGLSSSGKSTIANHLAFRLHELGKLTYVLDGDNIRFGLNKDLSFSPEDRRENIRRIGEVAKLFVDSGIITLAAFISPLKASREELKLLLGEDFVEIFVDCSVEVCEQRDPKELYAKARKGEIAEFTGLTSPYERPEKPQVVLHTDRESIDDSVDKVLQYLKAFNLKRRL